VTKALGFQVGGVGLFRLHDDIQVVVDDQLKGVGRVFTAAASIPGPLMPQRFKMVPIRNRSKKVMGHIGFERCPDKGHGGPGCALLRSMLSSMLKALV
jgi:hypothetical protein